MRSSLRVATCLVAVLAGLVAGTPASAQDRLFIGTTEVGAIGHFGQRLGPAPRWIQGQPFGGGRYVRGFQDGWHIFETRTGRAVMDAPAVVAVDPWRPRVFELADGYLFVHDVETGGRSLVTKTADYYGASWRPDVPFRYAPAADQIFAARFGLAPPFVVDVFDVATARLVRSLTVDDGGCCGGGPWTVTPDGAHLIDYAWNGAAAVLRIVDVRTGARRDASLAIGNLARLEYDAVFERILAIGSGGGDLQAFDLSGRYLGRLAGGYCPSIARVSPHTGRIYVLRTAGGGGSYYGAIDTRLTVLEGATGRVLDDVSVTAAFGLGTDRPVCGEMSLQLFTAPGPPRGLAARVSGSRVDLTWTNVGDAVHHVVEVGLAPGQRVAEFQVAGAIGASFAGVPPGTYYVRVRGGNVIGGGRPSAEIRVVVP